MSARLAETSTTHRGAAPLNRATAWARRVGDVFLSPTSRTFRRVALTGVVTSSAIIASGAVVRLSESGLGCPDWPNCTSQSLVAAGTTGHALIHRWVEFGNRLVNVPLFVVAVLVIIVAWRYRPAEGAARRRDLLWLAAAQPAFIVAQALIGGIVVLTKLNPGWVSVHFLTSMALVAAAVALYVRCQEGTGPARPLVRREVRWAAYAIIGMTAIMLAVGTVVTGAGPLAGAKSVPRYDLPLRGVTQLHADIGFLLGGLIAGLVLSLRLVNAPPRAMRLGYVLLALTAVQGVIGETQYFTGLPAALVWVHVVGAIAIWITALLLPYALRDRAATRPTVPDAQVEAARS